jgi:hypothetical protein
MEQVCDKSVGVGLSYIDAEHSILKLVRFTLDKVGLEACPVRRKYAHFNSSEYPNISRFVKELEPNCESKLNPSPWCDICAAHAEKLHGFDAVHKGVLIE